MYLQEVVFFCLPLLLTVATIILSFIFFRKLFHNNNKPIQANPAQDSALKTSSAADSTTSSSAVGGEYEVFLSFRGEDTRTGFTDFLYTYLVGASIRTFRDDNELRIGEEIGPDLLKVINESKISIPIFSKNYAGSKWCLIELAQMVECQKTEGKMIFPIFYDIEPCDVRNQKGGYEKAFGQHEKKFGKKRVERWKDGMSMVGKLKGLELKKTTNGNEGALVKMVVEEVMLMLKKNYTHLPDNLVGMDHHVKEMERLLDVNYNGVRIVGIHGMGGIEEKKRREKRQIKFEQLMAGKAILDEFIPLTSPYASATQFKGTYQVFLSFRGKDTRYGFTDHLYHNLVGAGIHTFRDDDKLRVGEDIGPELIKAIKDSKISIPIFSKNYAESKWCLREFAQIAECMEYWGQKIIPIFYDVEPYEVQHYERGSYNEAFVKYENDPSLDQTTVEEWKRALAIVGELKGLELKKETNGHEGELVKIVVEKVMLMLKKNHTHLPDILVGMDHHVEEMERLLDVNYNGVRIVGIHGMGGIGKTTISKFIYNRLCDCFDCCCFLDDVRERSQHHNGVVILQSELVSKITKQDVIKISNVGEGIDKIKDVVGRKKVLIVLDDIDGISQFHQLVGKCDWFGDGSRIVITTRNKDVLGTVEVTCRIEGLFDVFKSYEPQLMDDDQSLILFSNHAFNQKSPPQDYYILSKDVVATASGLPLVLVTIGSLLFGKEDRAEWEEILRKLQRIPHEEVLEKLRISFEVLNYEQKQIFLDIACLFIGKHKTNPFYMWDACRYYPRSGVNTLVLRSLVRVGEDNELRMHDQLRDLGRQIVREENLKEVGERSRVWDPQEALDLLKGGLGTKNLEALNLDLGGVEQAEFIETEAQRRLVREDFYELRNLRFLRLGCTELYGDFKHCFSNLRWLQWSSCGKFKPINLNLKNLVVLKLSVNKIADEWEGLSLFKEANNLKVLKLSYSNNIRRLNCSTFKDLECLIIHSCESLLEVKDLSKLTMLKKLQLIDLPNLHEIEGHGAMEFLEVLRMERCSIERFLDLSKSRMLKELSLRNCMNLREVGDLGGLVSLENLSVEHCYSLERLSGLSNLVKLKKLVVKEFGKLSGFVCFKGLVSLERLYLYSCKSLGKILDLSGLTKLKELKASDLKMEEIRGLEELRSLQVLRITNCSLLEKLSDLSNLRCLKTLHVKWCRKLPEIEGLDGLLSLEYLHFSYCKSLQKTFDISCLKYLKELEVSDLKHLTEITGLQELKFLEKLSIEDCCLLEKLPDLSNLKSLRTLNARGYEKLLEIH